MNESTNKSRSHKRSFYSQSEIAQTYNDQRFGGASGAWVNAREINLALELLPAGGRVLDLGCGTGRLTQALETRYHVTGMDASSAMLQVTQQATRAPLAQGDAFTLPFADNSFDAVVALRVVFHFAELNALLKEMRRVVTPGGLLVFDTYLWSPRALLPLDQRRWGTGIYIHPPAVIQAACAASDLQVVDQTECFLFSPYAYRRLPISLVQWLERTETHIPTQWRARAFWKIAKPVQARR